LRSNYRINSWALFLILCRLTYIYDTTASDGTDSVEERVRQAAEAGSDAIALTGHDVINSELDERFFIDDETSMTVITALQNRRHFGSRWVSSILAAPRRNRQTSKMSFVHVGNFGLKSLERLISLRGNKTMIRFTESYSELSTNGGDV
jgi:Predicted metal-dependent phosphoesterases (PHP family)